MERLENWVGISSGMLLTMIVALGTLQAQADSHTTPVGGVLEGHLCTYNEGQDREDLDALKDFYLKQAEKAGYKAPLAYLWTANLGVQPYDFAWVNVHESLSEFAAANDAYAASSELAQASERANKVMTCQANLSPYSYVFRKESAPEAVPLAIASYGCDLRPGQGFGELQALMDHISTVNQSMGDQALDEVVQVMPLTGDLHGPDVYVMAVSSRGASGWGEHLDAINASPAGRAVNAHFNAVLNCRMNLWNAEPFITEED